MIHEVFQRALEGSGPIFGTMSTFDSHGIPEALTLHHPDFHIIDCQHSFIDELEAQRLLYVLEGTGIPTLVRVSANDSHKIGKVLDAGADGVIVPTVNTADEAHAAVAACRYSPEGDRSFGPTRRRMGMKPDDISARVSCFVMVETVQGMANLKEICAVPGLAGIYMGPADLAITMGLPVMTHPAPAQLEQAAELIVEECRRAGIIAGVQGYPAARSIAFAEKGFQLITTGIDWQYIAAAVQAENAELDAYRRGGVPQVIAGGR